MSPAARAPALVILAAGASQRLGACKALVEIGGRTVLARLLAAGAACDGAPPLVVTGADHRAIAAAAGAAAEVVFNPRWESGRTSGVALARRLRPGLDLCLAPVDVPLAGPAVFAALLAAWREAGAPPTGWLAPYVDPPLVPRRRYGHPVVSGRDHLAALDERPTEVPLKLLRRSADPLLGVPVEEVAVLDDLDTPADLERLRERHAD